tara:strand:+ start:310 stop:696 length:387 start_codon:yes stop_codon:yes gene_type:complete
MLELFLAIFGLCSAIALAITWIISRRNPTVRCSRLLFDERLRQMRAEGYSRLWDDSYTAGELARAASEYAAASATGGDEASTVCQMPRPEWPWGGEHWRPKGRRDCLVKAGALIIAELERLDRMEGRS